MNPWYKNRPSTPRSKALHQHQLLDKGLSHVFKGQIGFEFWVLRFRDLGASFSSFGASFSSYGCFMLRSSFSKLPNTPGVKFSSVNHCPYKLFSPQSSRRSVEQNTMVMLLIYRESAVPQAHSIKRFNSLACLLLSEKLCYSLTTNDSSFAIKRHLHLLVHSSLFWCVLSYFVVFQFFSSEITLELTLAY